MNFKQDGLEKRLAIEARRISSQHRQLDEFHERVARAFDAGEPAQARSAFTRFRDALEAHFAVEDEVYFPAVHGLRRELEPELTAFVEEHKRMRAELERVQALLDDDRLTEAAGTLDGMVELLIAHESREEKLLTRIRG